MFSVCIQRAGSLTNFSPQPGRVVRAEAHDVFLDAENLEIFQIHFVDRVELGRELFRRAINVRVVHVQRAHAHEAEQLARLLVAIAGAVFRQAQRQIAVTARLRRKNAVVMRAVHGFEVVAFCPRAVSADRNSKIDFRVFRPRPMTSHVNSASA